MSFKHLLKTHEGRRIDKWQHYFPIYDKHFGSIYFEAERVLEIGIDHGGSLQIWKKFFPNAHIVGIDINPVCKSFEEDRISVQIGSQNDRAFLDTLGEFDVVIDDGSHVLSDQTASFSVLWPKTKMVYLIEDCHGKFPYLEGSPQLVYEYPWVVVAEKPRRIIRGTSSRELRPDEVEATEKYYVDTL